MNTIKWIIGGLAALALLAFAPGAQAQLGYYTVVAQSGGVGSNVVHSAATLNQTNQVTIPYEQVAIQIDQSGPFVLVVNSENKIEVRRVEPGIFSGMLLVIKSGLQAGDLVVTEGVQKVRPWYMPRSPLSTALLCLARPSSPIARAMMPISSTFQVAARPIACGNTVATPARATPCRHSFHQL